MGHDAREVRTPAGNDDAINWRVCVVVAERDYANRANWEWGVLWT